MLQSVYINFHLGIVRIKQELFSSCNRSKEERFLEHAHCSNTLKVYNNLYVPSAKCQLSAQ